MIIIRTSSSPIFFNVPIVLVSGAIASYGLMRPKVGAAMIGIGIVVSLLSPLVATGMELVLLRSSLAIQAFIVFVLNIVGIVLASSATFIIFDFRREDEKK